MTRLEDVKHLYALLNRLELAVGGKRLLEGMATAHDWPRRGVYFFFEPGEVRSHSGDGSRLVRIGTHGLGAGAKSTLRQRLKQHAGRSSGGGNHRGSVFRLLVGEALLARGDCPYCPFWGVNGDISKGSGFLNGSRAELSASEAPIELAVSTYLRGMPFLWLSVDDDPGPASLRGVIERNTIALTSNLQGPQIDPPSADWLGHASRREKVRLSSLWNQRHVDEDYDPAFLGILEDAIAHL